MEKFEKLGLSHEVLEVLKSEGFERPSDIQEKAIPLALAGKDIIGGSATGSGKTLAFASPIMENTKSGKGVQSLILTPTRELAEQVADSIKKFSKNKKLKVLAIYGGVRIDSQLRKIPQADVVVGTPGRILDHLKRTTLDLDKVKILVLDEVDRMFDMGFSRDVESIIQQCPEKRQTMMFSATISSEIDYLAKKYTRNVIEISVESYIDHSKLKQVYYDVQSSLKFSLLVHLLKKEDSDLTMVFCGTRRNVDFIMNNLKRLGIKAGAIHGGLLQNKRKQIIEDFNKKRINILICTDVAARGLDIKGVSHVYNYDLPTKSEDYVHRIGRTARAGNKGIAITILSSRDYENFGSIMENEFLKIDKREVPKVERMSFNIPQRNSGRDYNRRDSSRGRDASRGRFGRNSRESSGNRNSGRRYSQRNNSSKGRDSNQSRNSYARNGPNSRGSYSRNNSRSRDSNRSSSTRGNYNQRNSSGPRRNSDRNSGHRNSRARR